MTGEHAPHDAQSSSADAAKIWRAALGQLEVEVRAANFETWLRDTVGLRVDGSSFVVGAPNDFATEWLSLRLRPVIVKVLARVLGHQVDVSFEVLRPDEADVAALLPIPLEAVPEQYRRYRVPPALNPALTFDTFVVGDENRLAFEAARAAAQAGASTSTLCIFGAPGLGKTHLLNSIGHEAHAAGRAVIYAPAERFGNDYVRAMSGGFESFRARYRGCDVLLIDDVQFLETKPGFQREFFNTFNDLHALGKQIIITCDRAPARLEGLMDALRSRLQWGLVADLQKPNFHTRLAILRAKSKQLAVQLSEDVLVQIAERCCPSVRELEGYLHRVIAHVPLHGGDATPEIVERALSPLAPPIAAAEAPSDDVVLEAVSRRTGIGRSDLVGRSRSRDVSYARHLAMYVLREDARLPVAAIGRVLGHRDHSTVIAGVQRIAMELHTRPETHADAVAVREHIATARAAATLAV